MLLPFFILSLCKFLIFTNQQGHYASFGIFLRNEPTRYFFSLCAYLFPLQAKKLSVKIYESGRHITSTGIYPYRLRCDIVLIWQHAVASLVHKAKAFLTTSTAHSRIDAVAKLAVIGLGVELTVFDWTTAFTQNSH